METRWLEHLEDFAIVEIEVTWLRSDEQMGSKSKCWVDVPGDTEPWLFKYSRESAGQITGEHWAEKVGAEAAALLGVPHAQVELARLDGAWGAISRRFDALAKDDTELVHGNDILAGCVTGYDRDKQHQQSDHTLSNVIRGIHAVFTEERARHDALVAFAGYLVLDALILNTDRHHENWAVLRRTSMADGIHQCMAPSFDHASCLARNEPPSRLGQWLAQPSTVKNGRVAWYAERGEGGIYQNKMDKKGANPLELAIAAMTRWPAYFAPWRDKLAGLDKKALMVVVDRIPDQVIAPESRRFAQALLGHTLDRLTSAPT
jgi:hypothetical protein